MADNQAPQPGAQSAASDRPAQMEAQQPRPAQQGQPALRGRSAYGAAFGDGSGAAWVFRDLASI